MFYFPLEAESHFKPWLFHVHTYPRITDVSHHNGCIWVIADNFYFLTFLCFIPPLIKRHWHCTVGREERSLIHHIQRDWETGFWTDLVGDFTLIFSSILPADRIYTELALFWGKLHPLCESQTLVIEDPVNGDSRVGWEASEDHRGLYCDCGVDDSNDGLCHRLYKETKKKTLW